MIVQIALSGNASWLGMRGRCGRAPELNFNDDKGGKPVGINQHIGRRPIIAFGNSVGDQQMLEYTQGSGGARFQLLVLHDDAAREYAYGPARGLPDVKLGAFTPALDAHAKKDGWTVVSMKNDWKSVFPVTPSEITAIDILLQPDANMLQHAEANNARLLAAFPTRFTLDAAHRPHITLLQCFVRTADLDQVYAAAEKVLAAANVNAMQLQAFEYYYAPAGAVGVAGICAKPTPNILQLQADIIAALKPFMVETGPIGAFTAAHDDPATDAAIIQYVSTFVPKMSGENFNPYVSTGVAPRDYLDKMVAEPFEPFTFSPAGAAVYQLGPFGTAAKQLTQWNRTLSRAVPVQRAHLSVPQPICRRRWIRDRVDARRALDDGCRPTCQRTTRCVRSPDSWRILSSTAIGASRRGARCGDRARPT